MEKIVKKSIDTSITLLILSLLWAITILLLGGWWLYLLFYGVPANVNIQSLIKWEGGTFLLFLFFLSGTMLFLFIKDRKKSKTLTDFFASLTHELKTPLASIRLLSEVMNEHINHKKWDKIQVLSHQLIDEAFKLEIQMDKILQLSRIKRGGVLNLEEINLVTFIKKKRRLWKEKLNIELVYQQENSQYNIYADEFALDLIFKNLFENTLVHTRSKQATISLSCDHQSGITSIQYNDHGKFSADIIKLGQLFYKHQSPKGSGIGIYLISQLMLQMSATLTLSSENGLQYCLAFNSKEQTE